MTYEEHKLANSINFLARKCHNDARASGWYTDPKTGAPREMNFGEGIALMHSELSEAFEGYRKDLMDTHLPHRLMVEVELADAIIRIGQWAELLNLDVGGAIIEKMEYNRTREDHKPENRAKAGGKKF